MGAVRVRRHTLAQGTKIATIDPLDVVARPAHLKDDLRVHVFAAAGSIELVASPVRLSVSDACALRDALDKAIETVKGKLRASVPGPLCYCPAYASPHYHDADDKTVPT